MDDYPKDRVDQLVDKFLAWPLPDSVAADAIACTQGAPHRTGTNLLNATEARQMIEYLLFAGQSTGMARGWPGAEEDAAFQARNYNRSL
jgi:hypothetical protein